MEKARRELVVLYFKISGFLQALEELDPSFFLVLPEFR